MYRYKRLHFFDKNGDEIGLSYNSSTNIWSGSIHLPKVSVGLFENQTIYIIEEFEDTLGNVIYGKPHISQSATNRNIKVGWTDLLEKSFNFFAVDNPLNQNPVISFNSNADGQLGDSSTDVYNPSTDRLITTNNITSPYRIDVCFVTDEENAYSNTMVISDSVGVIAEIEFYGESTGEDERFATLLGNFGEYITEREEFIFRNSDINEDFPNYEIINRKRKELLLEFHNIKPYLASYKGIINIIKFFGYTEVRLKEYWKNVETGKFTLDEVKIGELDRLDKKSELLSYPYQKTSNFGLFYDINEVVPNEYDEKGLPVTKDSDIFSNEEILIKLFGLKNYIKDRQIGGVARIVDIIGEVVYFNRYKILHWIDQSQTFKIDPFVDPVFSTNKQYGYIDDLRPYLNNYSTCPLPQNIVGSDNIVIGNYPDCFLGYFTPLSQDEPQYLDEPQIPVGCVVTLTNNSFDISWGDLQLLWQTLAPETPVITWANIGSYNHYEIEWRINKQVNLVDTRQWSYSKRGNLNDLKFHDVILPYDGTYDVTLILYAYNNIVSTHVERSFIQVKLKEADFICWFKYYNDKLQHWGTNNRPWNKIYSQWANGEPIFDNDNLDINSNDVTYRSFNLVNFVELLIDGNPNVGIRDYLWDDYDNVTWQDLMFNRWKDFHFEREKLGRFIIEQLQASGYLQIGRDEIQIPSDFNIHDFVALANLLQQQITADIQKFDYLPRPMDVTPTFVDATAQDSGPAGDIMVGGRGGIKYKDDMDARWLDLPDSWSTIPITWENMEHFYHARALQEPYSLDNSKVYKDRFTAPAMIPIFMSVDNSKMPGKTKVRWLITNDNTGEVDVYHEYLYMAYRFNNTGEYTITVEIEDTNGNINRVTKNKNIKILKGLEFDNYLYHTQLS